MIKDNILRADAAYCDNHYVIVHTAMTSRALYTRYVNFYVRDLSVLFSNLGELVQKGHGHKSQHIVKRARDVMAVWTLAFGCY